MLQMFCFSFNGASNRLEHNNKKKTGGETFSFNHTWLTKLHYEGGENVDNEALKVQSW